MYPPLTQAYLVDVNNPNRKVEFQFMPTELSEDKFANWESIPILGRSDPIQGYGYSGARRFTLTLRFFAGEDKRGGIIDPGVVKARVDYCRSLLYPEYGETPQPPPDILYIVGNLLASRVICKSYRVRYTAPWDTISLLPFHAEVNLALEEINEVPFSRSEVYEGIDIFRVSPSVQSPTPDSENFNDINLPNDDTSFEPIA